MDKRSAEYITDQNSTDRSLVRDRLSQEEYDAVDPLP